MSHITEQELDHLAKLSALQLSAEQKETLLPQLDRIIGLVDQLKECDVTISEEDKEDVDAMVCNEWVDTCMKREDFLAGVYHPTERNMVELKTNTNEG